MLKDAVCLGLLPKFMKFISKEGKIFPKIVEAIGEPSENIKNLLPFFYNVSNQLKLCMWRLSSTDFRKAEENIKELAYKIKQKDNRQEFTTTDDVLDTLFKDNTEIFLARLDVEENSEVLTNEEITVIAENYTSIFKFQTSKYNKSEIQKLQLERKKMLRENRNKIKEERANVLLELEECTDELAKMESLKRKRNPSDESDELNEMIDNKKGRIEDLKEKKRRLNAQY